MPVESEVGKAECSQASKGVSTSLRRSALRPSALRHPGNNCREHREAHSNAELFISNFLRILCYPVLYRGSSPFFDGCRRIHLASTQALGYALGDGHCLAERIVGLDRVRRVWRGERPSARGGAGTA